MLDSVTYHLNKLFSSLSQSFPNYVYAPHNTDDEDEVLINESEKEGKKFSTHFRDVYGDSCSQFMDSSLLDAITISSLEKKPLVLYLASSCHENYYSFTSLLANRVVVEHLKENYVCWGCDVTSQYGFSLVTEISCPISELPVLIILYKKNESTAIRLLGCIHYSASLTPEVLTTTIDLTVAQTMEEIRRDEQEQYIREENRRIVQQQQQEYEAAVAADREIMNSARSNDTPLEATHSEPEPEPTTNDLEMRMNAIRQAIPPEPRSGDIVHIRVVYPNGTRLQRNFLSTDSVSLLYELVELDIYDNAMDIASFQLCTTVSNQCIQSSKQQESFQQMGIRGSCVFRVRVFFSFC